MGVKEAQKFRPMGGKALVHPTPAPRPPKLPVEPPKPVEPIPDLEGPGKVPVPVPGAVAVPSAKKPPLPPEQIERFKRDLAKDPEAKYPEEWFDKGTLRYDFGSVSKGIRQARFEVWKGIWSKRIASGKQYLSNKASNTRKWFTSRQLDLLTRPIGMKFGVKTALAGAAIIGVVSALSYALTGNKPSAKNPEVSEFISASLNSVTVDKPFAAELLKSIKVVKDIVTENQGEDVALSSYIKLLDHLAQITNGLSVALQADNPTSVSGYLTALKNAEQEFVLAFNYLEKLQKFFINKQKVKEGEAVGALMADMSEFLMLISNARGAVA